MEAMSSALHLCPTQRCQGCCPTVGWVGGSGWGWVARPRVRPLLGDAAPTSLSPSVACAVRLSGEPRGMGLPLPQPHAAPGLPK